MDTCWFIFSKESAKFVGTLTSGYFNIASIHKHSLKSRLPPSDSFYNNKLSLLASSYAMVCFMFYVGTFFISLRTGRFIDIAPDMEDEYCLFWSIVMIFVGVKVGSSSWGLNIWRLYKDVEYVKTPNDVHTARECESSTIIFLTSTYSFFLIYEI